MNQTRTPRSVTSCAAVHITSRRASTRAPSLVFDSSKHEAFVGASQVESSPVVLRSLVDCAGRIRPNQPMPAPRLTDEPPTRAGANTMRRRSRVLRPLPFRPAPMTPSARRGFGDEPPSSRWRFLKNSMYTLRERNRLITRLRWRPPRLPGWRSCLAAAASARSACPAPGTPSDA